MTRPLSPAEKLALIYTSAGSQRSVAALVGISHQKAGRILKTGDTENGGYSINSRALSDPGLLAAIDSALAIHTDIAKEQARADKLPFSSAIPVFYETLTHKDGRKGSRVAAKNTHWLSDTQRNAWITAIQKTGKFYAATVRSVVNLKKYNRQSDKRNKEDGNPRRTVKQALHKTELNLLQRINEIDGVQNAPIYTAYTPLAKEFPISAILADMTEKLRRKHEPATGDAGTVLADQIILQLDTRKVKDAKPTKARAAKPRQSRKAKPRAKRR